MKDLEALEKLREKADELLNSTDFYYNLDENKNPVSCTLREWGEIYMGSGNDERRIAEDYINDFHISTVFLGIDHNFYEGPPILFETMIFENDSYSEIYCDRYCTWQEAEEGHKKAVEWAKNERKEE